MKREMKKKEKEKKKMKGREMRVIVGYVFEHLMAYFRILTKRNNHQSRII